ncbi:small VCP/p97-interacting protein-like isoform X1 [Acropora millepora]|uniref:small VCP/p97-interacting protein-like isoform X1 n=1 Tax=Acropora millepora TaxID=45264 RepID=UPI001CF4C940|nr:small VCP/p97-interacting protein-like isoform X1 [Acropora millepora]
MMRLILFHSATRSNKLQKQKSSDNVVSEIRRRQQEEAALKRQQQSEARGVRDPERLKREQMRKENREKEALKQGPSDGGLKWTVG